MEQRRRFATLVFAVAGACTGLTLMGLLAWITVTLPQNQDSPFMKVFLLLNWPPIAFLEWVAKVFKHGNPDQMLGYWLLILPFYWILLGAVVGLGCHLLMRYRKK